MSAVWLASNYDWRHRRCRRYIYIYIYKLNNGKDLRPQIPTQNVYSILHSIIKTLYVQYPFNVRCGGVALTIECI